jgi:aminoglycoside phosphotransferase (APT) family kinase protein
MLRRFHGVRFGLLKSAVGRVFNRLGVVDVAARDITVVGWLPEGDDATPPRTVPLHVPAPRRTDYLDGAPWSTLLMTPWFDASRHVLALYVATGTRRIAAVAKLPRRSWDVGGIETEAAALRAVEAAGQGLERAAPKVLHERLDGARPYLLQSGVVGTAIGPEVVRRSPAAVLEAGTALIAQLAHAGTPTAAASVARLVDAPLDRLAAALALDEASRLVDRSKALLQPLRSATVPAVLEHGDFGHPNLVLVAGNRMTAVDWERFEPAGLPGLDLVFFLQYVKECLNSAVTVESQLQAFDQAFVGPDAWAGPTLSRYAAQLRIPAELLPCLVLGTWCRTAAGLVPRLEPRSSSPAGSSTDGVAGADHLAETITRDRDYLLWRHAVQRFESVLH